MPYNRIHFDEKRIVSEDINRLQNHIEEIVRILEAENQDLRDRIKRLEDRE